MTYDLWLGSKARSKLVEPSWIDAFPVVVCLFFSLSPIYSDIYIYIYIYIYINRSDCLARWYNEGRTASLRWPISISICSYLTIRSGYSASALADMRDEWARIYRFRQSMLEEQQLISLPKFITFIHIIIHHQCIIQLQIRVNESVINQYTKKNTEHKIPPSWHRCKQQITNWTHHSIWFEIFWSRIILNNRRFSEAGKFLSSKSSNNNWNIKLNRMLLSRPMKLSKQTNHY